MEQVKMHIMLGRLSEGTLCLEESYNERKDNLHLGKWQGVRKEIYVSRKYSFTWR